MTKMAKGYYVEWSGIVFLFLIYVWLFPLVAVFIGTDCKSAYREIIKITFCYLPIHYL
jgi:hypothetical protein